MKRLILLSAMFFLLLGGFALAAGGVTNPFFNTAHLTADDFLMPMAAGLQMKIVCDQAPSLEQEGKWTIEIIDDGEGEEQEEAPSYEYRYYIVDAESIVNNVVSDTHGHTISGEPHYSYSFVVPGKYMLLVYVYQDGVRVGYKAKSFTLENDGTRITTDEKIAQIVSECIEAGCESDYEKALWLHDWLTTNARYDETYSYYSADGVLIRGVGVCDSYCKAYLKLLEACGISNARVTGGNHAWNLVELEGSRYHIDATWDDPLIANSEEALSGFENHFYFGLPDEIMRQDHTYPLNTASADAYDCNYFIQSGKVSAWTALFEDVIREKLDAAELSFSLGVPVSYPVEGEYTPGGKGYLVYAIVSYALRNMDWAVGDKTVTIDMAYFNDARAIRADVDLSGYTMILPEGLTEIGQEAFAGNTGVMAVEIPEGAKRIGEGAFAGCTELWSITIPATVSEIAEDALADCTDVTVFCMSGSAAEAFALRNGLKCVASAETGSTE